VRLLGVFLELCSMLHQPHFDVEEPAASHANLDPIEEERNHVLLAAFADAFPHVAAQFRG
jgi:hypothetical protein